MPEVLIFNDSSLSRATYQRRVRLKNAASINRRVLSELTDPAWEMLYVDISNVQSGRVQSPIAVEFVKAPSRARRIPIHGDTLFSTVRTYLRAIAYMDSPAENTIASTGFAVLTPQWYVFPKYLYWAVVEESFIQEVVARSVGVSYPAIVPSELSDIRLHLPRFEAQRHIASFLDRETAKIDGLVAEQRRLMELLKEKRQAVISHAVTKGLNPDALMIPSGIEWLGDVPAHWQVMPIRYAAKLESGHTPSRQHPEWWVDCTIPWFSLADVWQLRRSNIETVVETKECVSQLGLQNSSARLLPSGTVMLSRTASVGFSAIMGVSMATTQDFANWICSSKLLPEYLLYTFRSMGGEFQRLMMGSTHNTIYMPEIQAFRFALPPIDEQEKIVAFIRSEAAGFDDLTGAAENAMALLQERRTALISAAVTGEIDVRGFVAKGSA